MQSRGQPLIERLHVLFPHNIDEFANLDLDCCFASQNSNEKDNIMIIFSKLLVAFLLLEGTHVEGKSPRAGNTNRGSTGDGTGGR
jgi:hypothetical protein